MKSPPSGRRHHDERAIDRFLGSFDVGNSHTIEVAASPEETYRALRAIDLGRSLPVATLLMLRGLPHLVTGKARLSRSVTLDTALQLGFTIFEEDPPRELVIGVAGRFWRPDSDLVRVTAEEFLRFDAPGYAKAVMSFTVEEHGDGSLLSTETRVATADEAARKKFSLYWRVVGPFSGLIRKIMLDQVKREAEGA